MKTQEDLYLEYARCITMTREYNDKNGTDVKPWECVKVDGETMFKTPAFNRPHNAYTFALTILEGKPVFEDSEGFVGEYACLYAHTPIDRIWSWRKPITKKRTFMLGDRELPCPVNKETGFTLSVQDSYGCRFTTYFDSSEDSRRIVTAFSDLLFKARHKE